MNTNDATRATARALPKIDRSAAIARQAQLSGFIEKLMEPQPLMTPREQAIWHLRELEQLVREDGGTTVVVQAIASYTCNEDCRMIGIRPSGHLACDDNMFAPEGGAA